MSYLRAVPSVGGFVCRVGAARIVIALSFAEVGDLLGDGW
jgi:hypothetical protein